MGETNPQALPDGAADQMAAAARFRAKKPVLFGRYELLTRFRVGGMAEVWTAKRLAGGGELLAIKRILPSFTDEADYVAMFRDEARLAQRLTHENIVITHEVGQLEDQPFLVLEHIHGQTVAALIRKAREAGAGVPPSIALRIALDVLSALQHAHTLQSEHGRPLGIVHRDVSPTNVLLAYDGRVKLIDFGVAKSSDQLMRTQAGLLKGKHGYLSPEQALGETVDLRSDLFSLAICIWELLAAKRLFLGSSDFSSIVRVRQAVVPPLTEANASVPEALAKVLERALARDPKDRFQSAGEMRDALEVVAGEGTAAADAAELERYMRATFADELRLEENDATTTSAPAPYEGTGLLDAFDDLEPVSAVSVLAQLPDAESQPQRIDTLEADEVEEIETGEEDLEIAQAAALETSSPSRTDELELMHEPDAEDDEVGSAKDTLELEAGAVPQADAAPSADESATPMELAAPLADLVEDTAKTAPVPDVLATADEATASDQAAERDAEQDEPDEPTRVVAYRSTESGELDAANAAAAAAKLAAIDAVTADEKLPADASTVEASVSALGEAPAATLPGLGSVEWDDEELSTHLYDGPSASALIDGVQPLAPTPVLEDASAAPSTGASPSGSPPAVGVSRPSIAPFSSRPSLPVSLQRASVPPGATPSFPPPAALPRASMPAPPVSAWQNKPWVLPALIVALGALVLAALMLFQAPSRGTIQLTTSPSDARVLFDGRPVSGNLSPFVIADVKAGDLHQLEVSRDGFRTWTTELKVGPGQTLQLPEVALVEMPSSLPQAAAVPAPIAPAPAAAGEASPSTTTAPEPSPHREAVRPSPAPAPRPAPQPSTAAGRRPSSKPVVPQPAPRPVRPAPQPHPQQVASGETGMLRINTRPWSQVHVDGRLIGNTPQMAIKLSPGKHTVLLINPEFGLRKTLTVQITRGAVVTKIVNLQ